MDEIVRTAKVKALSVGKFTVTRTGLILNGDPSWQEWELFMPGLAGVHSAISWAVGDALREIETRFGDSGYQLTAAFPEREYKTLLNYRWVAGKIDYSLRKESLSFSHHALVASLDRDDMSHFLEEAVSKDWTVRELRSKLGKGTNKKRNQCPNCGHEW